MRMRAIDHWMRWRYRKATLEKRKQISSWLEQIEPQVGKKAEETAGRLRAEGFALHLSLWQCDHVFPVSEGGGHCGLDGLRTLCFRCHKKVTADLRKRLALNRATNLQQMTLIP